MTTKGVSLTPSGEWKATVAEEPQNEGASGADRITIVLVDDHAIVRGALRLLLDEEPDFEVVAEGGDAEAGLRYVAGHKPDVVVLDLNLPGMSGLEAIPEIRMRAPETRIVVLTMRDEIEFVREALKAGVHGYILKEAAQEELVQAVRLASKGNRYVQPALGARMAVEPDSGLPDELSEREGEVLRLIALGHTNPEIAGQLYLSVRTIESHRANIQAKLGLSARSELVRYAIDHRMVDLGN
jgi:two-component system response regulator NreC